DRHPAIDGSKPSDAVIDNPRLAAGLRREERELPLDVRDLPVHTVQVVDRLLHVAAPPSEHIVGFPESVGWFRHRQAEDWKRPVGPDLDGDEAGLERARANECRRVADADEVHAVRPGQLNAPVRLRHDGVVVRDDQLRAAVRRRYAVGRGGQAVRTLEHPERCDVGLEVHANRHEPNLHRPTWEHRSTGFRSRYARTDDIRSPRVAGDATCLLGTLATYEAGGISCHAVSLWALAPVRF